MPACNRPIVFGGTACGAGRRAQPESDRETNGSPTCLVRLSIRFWLCRRSAAPPNSRVPRSSPVLLIFCSPVIPISCPSDLLLNSDLRQRLTKQRQVLRPRDFDRPERRQVRCAPL